MPLRDTLEKLMTEAKAKHPTPASAQLPNGLKVAARLNPPRLLLWRDPKADGTGSFRSDDPHSEKEGFRCAVQLGWTPWLVWSVGQAGQEYLTVCDRRLWYGLRDAAVSHAGGDTEKAIFLRYDINEENPPPVRIWELCATGKMDGLTHKQLCAAVGVKLEKK